ncbi:LAME_0C09582g1_1 [Lachancea meyersii CBS 8951]|uniref:LAME_0C09582g1_1 n=1 Tax=Lachancea meyersii CBS 8951 TaxID=1266667 RepID=A0A1G4J3Y6_9SACH|nr:LAME_0C09582g1_1 [Lachancea meyersii CBS 8951]
MSNATSNPPVSLPCGKLYNLTISADTSAMEGWCCGQTALSGWDTRNDTLSHNFTAISCNYDQMLYIDNSTSAVDGYLCGLGYLSSNFTQVTSQTSSSAKIQMKWSHLVFFGSLLTALVI